MTYSNGYILILDQHSNHFRLIESLLDQTLPDHQRCRVYVADSFEQAVHRAAQMPPYLVILAGSNKSSWSQRLARRLRQAMNTAGVTIVALTDSDAPSWFHQEENPELDGFLVRPLTPDVLSSLVQSALAKQACWVS